MKDYMIYHFTKTEKLKYVTVGMVGSFGVLYLFYQSAAFCLLTAVGGAILYIKYKKKQLAEKRQWELMLEFKDAMDSLISALTAGYSMENAMSEAYRDLTLMYGRETMMTRELWDIQQRLTLQQPLDELLLDLGRRSGVEDIVTFAQIYATARRSGGNLVKVMRRTADNISGKVEVQREIQTAIAGKKMESMCMMVIPLLIILYLQIFSPGFLDPLYQDAKGRIFMTGALVVYGVAVLWSRSIMKRASC